MPATIFEYDILPDFTPTERDLACVRQSGAAFRAVVAQGRIALQATQYVGVARFERQTFQILPRLYRDTSGDPAQQARQATRHLFSLLSYAGMIPFQKSGHALLRPDTSDWFEILTRLFATALRDAWKRDPVRRYVTQEDMLTALRGKWLLPEQSRRPAQRHCFRTAHDDLTADNPLNQVLRFVVECLWQQTRDPENHDLLGALRQNMAEVALLPALSDSDFASAALSRPHRLYTPLLNLARLFREGGALSLLPGSAPAFAFLLDMNVLFEAFVIGFLQRHRNALFPPEWASATLLPQAQGARRFLAQTERGAAVLLRPDILIRRGETFPLILDTKYKQPDVTERALGIVATDLYQMLAYAHRYACPRVLLLYPRTGEQAEWQQRFAIQDGSGITLEAATLDLRADFHRSEEQQRLIARLKTLLIGATC
jgi:5-methylcytosine-specific restriction enzyme subunit McrC